MASWAVPRAFARTKNHQLPARQSRIPPNNNRQGINHFGPRPPANRPPPGYTTPDARSLVAHACGVPGRAKPGLRPRPKADAASTRSAVPAFGVRRFSFVRATACKAHPPSPERQQRVGPHRRPSATTTARAQNPSRPNSNNAPKSPPPDTIRHCRPSAAQNPRTDPIPWRKAPALPRTESSVLRPTGQGPTRTEQTQSVAGSSPHARIHIRASVPASRDTKHETQITLPPSSPVAE